MDQRARLIEEGRGKGNPELHGRQGKALFQNRAFGIERRNLFAALAIVAGFQDIVGQFRQNVIFDHHMVWRRIAILGVVIVGNTNIHRITPDGHGDLINDAFNRDHALRPAKTTKRRVGHKIGFAAVRPDFDIAKVIGVVGMEHRPISNRRRQISRKTAIGGILDIQPANPPVIIKADIIIDNEIMAFAGHDHVVIAIKTELGRTSGFGRNNGGQCRPLHGLCFLAAKPAAHAAHFDRNRIGRTAQHIGNIVLHLGRMLGGAMQQHIAILARNGKTDLPFKVKMILPANVHPPGMTMLGARQSRLGIALLHHMWRCYEKLLFQCFGNIQNRRQFFIFDFCQLGCGTGLRTGFCSDTKDRLAIKLHDAIGQNRLIIGVGWRNVILTWNIIGGQNTYHARCSADLGQVQLANLAMRDGRRTRCQMQGAKRFIDIINIDRLARHMFGAAIMF